MAGTCKDCIKCDYNNSITSFPLKLGVIASETLYDSVDEPITMNFQWASRSTSPQFIPGGGKVDEGGSGLGGSGATNVSTINFNSVKYNLYSVQLAGATHNQWILPVTAQASNTEDIIITFYNPNTTIQYNYIMIVIPILRTGSAAKDPIYLQALSNNEQRGVYSLSSCLPQDVKSLFTYYATCIDGYTEHKKPENVYVFVSIAGLPVSPGLMTTLSSKAGASGFPPVDMPFITKFAQQITSINNHEFTQYVLSTRHLLDYSGISRIYKDMALNSRTDSTDSYQCVPLDPDTDVVNGQITVDLEKAQLLSAVLAERDAVRLSAAPIKQTASGKKRIEAYLGSALGILCAIIIAFILLYFIVSYVSPKSVSTTAAAPATAIETASWVQQIPMYGIMVIIAGLAGFSIGATLS